MPKEQSDNTKVNIKEQFPTISLQQQKMYNVTDQLYDADKIDHYNRMQNLYNHNALFGYGISGHQTNYSPRTQSNLIQSNFDYAKENARNFAETVITTGATEGLIDGLQWAFTPRVIGQGAEAVVSSAPISTTVTKVTTIPRAEMHIRNTVPGAVKARYIGTQNGLRTYVQDKVHILSRNQLNKAKTAIENVMKNKGWRKINHPNLQGDAYTNGRYVVSDLGEGNVGVDWLGRIRFPDFAIESVPEFKLAMQKLGGIIFKIN